MSETEPLEGKTILIVEDDPFVALDLAHTMERAGASVEGPYATVDAALSAIGDQPPDAAVLDVDLGGETCLPVADRLASLSVPFVFHTGTSDSDQLAEYDALIISKPTNPPGLLSAFLGALEQHAAARGQA